MSGIALATFSEFLNDPETLGTYFAAESWRGWKTIAKAIYGEGLSKAETAFFKSIAGDRDPPKRRVREVWAIGEEARILASVSSVGMPRSITQTRSALPYCFSIFAMGTGSLN